MRLQVSDGLVVTLERRHQPRHPVRVSVHPGNAVARYSPRRPCFPEFRIMALIQGLSPWMSCTSAGPIVSMNVRGGSDVALGELMRFLPRWCGIPLHYYQAGELTGNPLMKILLVRRLVTGCCGSHFNLLSIMKAWSIPCVPTRVLAPSVG